MTKTAVDEFTPIPVTRFTGRVRDIGRVYPPLTSPLFQEADGLLLSGLEQAMLSFGHYFDVKRTVPCVRGLDEQVVQELVDSLEARQRYLHKWSLAGDEAASVFDRLDEHFVPFQEAWAELRREQKAAVERRQREERERDEQFAVAFAEDRRGVLQAELDALGVA